MFSMFKFKFNRLSQTQMIVGGFFLIILVGALLLMLPIATKDGTVTSFVDTLFTATSATCVTGLVVEDTFQHWTLFGQIIILLLIQVGGLGFMTVGVLFAILLRRKIGLKTRGLIQESVNTLQIGGIVRLVKRILKGTLLLEGCGAILLAIRFIPDYGIGRGIYFGIFHSISAFCNAGFDLFGINDSFSSLTAYRGDILVNVVIMFLIASGGIGFLVWDDIVEHGIRLKEYKLHTKIVLVTTSILILGGAILFYIFEKNGLMTDMPVKDRILSSLFASITPRTAGFNTVDVAAMQETSKLLTIVLMFIGGSPGSTAGGIKTTTLVVLIISLRANLRRSSSLDVFNRRLEDDSVKKATQVLCTNLFLVIAACFMIGAMQDFKMLDVSLEVVSAMSTVGLTTGITADLNSISKLILVFIMYCGRVGSMSFALSFTENRKVAAVKQVAEKITIG